MRTSELTGQALDWAVAKCEGKNNDIEVHGGNVLYGRCSSGFVHYTPSTNWAQGGPIIARERIAVTCTPDAWCAFAHDGLQDVVVYGVHAGKAYNWRHRQNADTPLIAAMRCYVASKLGDEVDIPSELTQGETV